MSSSASIASKQDMIVVILPDGSRKEFPRGATGYDVAAGISAGLARAAIAAEVDGEMLDLHAALVPATEGQGGQSPFAPRTAQKGTVPGGAAVPGGAEALVRIITKRD